jgi:hypothetical protein
VATASLLLALQLQDVASLSFSFTRFRKRDVIRKWWDGGKPDVQNGVEDDKECVIISGANGVLEEVDCATNGAKKVTRALPNKDIAHIYRQNKEYKESKLAEDPDFFKTLASGQWTQS